MQLSYWWRLVCLMLVSIGAIQIFLDVSLWLVSPSVMRLLGSTSVRTKERMFFAAQMATHLLACLLPLLFLVPQYMRRETNLLQEQVGTVCILFAVVVFGRYTYAALRALMISALTLRWHRRFRTSVQLPAAEVPAVSSAEQPALALVGLFSPRIFISSALLKERTLTPAALDVAIAHENSHARNRDNLKLLLLSCLPHLGFKTPRRPSVVRQWQLLAELAADHDAVRENPNRAILLAEALLAVARTTSQRPRHIFSAALLPHEEDLETRITRLLHPASFTAGPDRPSEHFLMMTAAAFLLTAAIVLFGFVVSCWNTFAERLLHLG